MAAPVRTPVKAASAALITPVNVDKGDGSTSAKLLLVAAFALILVAAVSASLLRLLVRLNRPQRGW